MLNRTTPPYINLTKRGPSLLRRLVFKPIAGLAFALALSLLNQAQGQLTRPEAPRGLTILANVAAPVPALIDGGPTATPTCSPDAFTATLTGSQEVPPNNSSGIGSATVTLNRNPAQSTITVNLAFSGLSGNATAAHIHAPAPPGVTGPIVIPLPIFQALLRALTQIRSRSATSRSWIFSTASPM